MCPDGYEAHGDGCYRYETKPSSWEDADHFCRNLGANLAVVNSGGESAAAYVVTRSYNSSYWIGLKRDKVQIHTILPYATEKMVPSLFWLR